MPSGRPRLPYPRYNFATQAGEAVAGRQYGVKEATGGARRGQAAFRVQKSSVRSPQNATPPSSTDHSDDFSQSSLSPLTMDAIIAGLAL
jgi:hypothetical protein